MNQLGQLGKSLGRTRNRGMPCMARCIDLRPQMIRMIGMLRCSDLRPHDLGPQTSGLRPQTSDLRPQASDLGPQTSDLRPQTSDPPLIAGDDPYLHDPTLLDVQGAADEDLKGGRSWGAGIVLFKVNMSNLPWNCVDPKQTPKLTPPMVLIVHKSSKKGWQQQKGDIDYLIEFPKGGRKGKYESEIACMTRELEEETGIDAQHIRLVEESVALASSKNSWPLPKKNTLFRTVGPPSNCAFFAGV